ncbi:MAG: hypothetical protein AAF485_10120 [Chloroflexota bacterium]
MGTFAEMATLSANTKRATVVDGKRAAPSAHLIGLNCTPLDPVSADVAQREQIITPHELKQTFIEGDYDIVEGDVLVVDGVDYPIKSVADWSFGELTTYRLIIEELKR